MANSLLTSSSPIKDVLETSYPRILLLLSWLLNWQAIFSKCTGPGTEDFLCLLFQAECSSKRSKNRGTGINNAWELQVQEALVKPAANAQLSLAFAAFVTGFASSLCVPNGNEDGRAEEDTAPLISSSASLQLFWLFYMSSLQPSLCPPNS